MKRLISILAALTLMFVAASACAGDTEFILTEESGGVFRPLPVNLEIGRAHV